MSEQAARDENRVTAMLFRGSDGGTYNVEGDEVTGRLFVDASAGAASQIIVANEASDTTCFPIFAIDASGTIQPKTNTGLTFNASTSRLNATILASSSLTASQILITDASKNLVSASTTTYPSLTELAFVKGLTSSAQTQLAAKVALTGNQTVAGIKTFSSIPVLPASDPTTANQATRKAYVDAVASAINPALTRLPCRVATTADITIATALNNGDTIDGVVLATNDRVLVKNQNTAAQNGIYVVAASPARATDSDTAAEVAQGTNTYVAEGTQLGLYVQIEVVSTLNTDAINYALVGSPSSYVFAAGTTGTDFDVDVSGLNITYNLPDASTTNRGALISADWDTFNAKVDGPGTVDSGTLVVFNGTDGKTIQDSVFSISGTTMSITGNGVIGTSGTLGISAADDITVQPQAQGGATSAGHDVFLNGGQGGGTSGNGGNVTLEGGLAQDNGGNVVIRQGPGAFGEGKIQFGQSTLFGSGGIMELDLSLLTGTRIVTIPDEDGTLVYQSGTETLTNKTLGGYKLDGTPDTDQTANGPRTSTFNSGYSSAIGDLVFFGSSGKWLEVDANAVATCKGLLGIALEVKSNNQAMLVALPGSFVREDSWNWTVGATLYAGETLGAMQETIPTGADAIIKVVGFAVSTDVIFFNPSQDQQSTVA